MKLFRSITVLFTFLFLLCSTSGAVDTAKEDAEKRGFKRNNIKTAGKPIKPAIPPEYKNLVKAYDEYWGAVREKEYRNAYLLESSKYRQGVSLEKYKEIRKPKKGGKAVNIVSVRALNVKKINEKEVVVEGIIAYKSSFVDTIRPVKDKWINEKDGWKHIPAD